jgi:hypothetical protein
MLNSGDAGTLVKIVPTAANPSDNDGWSNSSVGASVAGTVSLRYETKGKLTPTVSGDDKHDALGLTLFDTRELDENGLPLKYYPQRAKEIFAVRSGEAVPVATRGTFGVWGKYVDTSLAVPTPGFPVVISRSGDGKLAAVDPSVVTQYNVTGGVALNGQVYGPDQVVGKWISTSGSQFASQGGFYFFRLTL